MFLRQHSPMPSSLFLIIGTALLVSAFMAIYFYEQDQLPYRGGEALEFSFIL